MIEIAKLIDEDRGMIVLYVPKYARHDGNEGWLGHTDTMWGTIIGWDDTSIQVSFDQIQATQLCDPEDIFPEHRGSYAKRNT